LLKFVQFLSRLVKFPVIAIYQISITNETSILAKKIRGREGLRATQDRLFTIFEFSGTHFNYSGRTGKQAFLRFFFVRHHDFDEWEGEKN